MIKITDITPLLRAGYVACDWNGTWCWYARKPRMLKTSRSWVNVSGTQYEYPYLYCFKDIAPADDWTQSLIKVGGNDD